MKERKIGFLYSATTLCVLTAFIFVLFTSEDDDSSIEAVAVPGAGMPGIVVTGILVEAQHDNQTENDLLCSRQFRAGTKVKGIDKEGSEFIGVIRGHGNQEKVKVSNEFRQLGCGEVEFLVPID